jgi:chromatin segregation and condensation protein Rec8/ScpA/Scc1 (kleisin family)
VQSRAGLIVTFLAMLEMIRLKLIRVFQSGALGPIRVYKRARPADAPKPLLDPEQRHADEVAAHQHARTEAAGDDGEPVRERAMPRDK